MIEFWGSYESPLAKEAENLFSRAYNFQMRGQLDLAIKYYQESIRVYPTAEAHTFLGWAYSFQGKIMEAIEQCKIAISVDPDFGNPYNDIGSYLITLKRPQEAIPWLEKAIEAKRYEPRHFPYINLARAYVLLHRETEAIEHLVKAFQIEPKDRSTLKEIRLLLGRLN
jgi:tetratricopeptide (TPR) repeat protein